MDSQDQAQKQSEYAPKDPRRPSRGGRVVSRTLKILVIAISALVWGAFLLTIFFRRNDALLSTPILSDSARAIYEADTAGFTTYQLYPAIFMNDDATIQFDTAVYAEKAHEIEVGVRLTGKITDRAENGKLTYVLRDSNGNRYTLVNRISTDKSFSIAGHGLSYSYERIAFSDVYLQLDDNIINQESRPSRTGRGSLAETISFRKKTETGTAYTLELYNAPDDKTPVFTMVFYNNNTYIKEIQYALPKSSYLSRNEISGTNSLPQ